MCANLQAAPYDIDNLLYDRTFVAANPLRSIKRRNLYLSDNNDVSDVLYVNVRKAFSYA